MADIIFHNYMTLEAEKEIDLENDSLIIVLLADTYSPSVDHTQYSDVSGHELATANGYTQKTKALANVTVTDDDANDRANVDCDDISWTASGGSITARYAAVIDDSVTDDPLVYLFDFGENKTAGDGTDFKITIDDTNGWFYKAQA